MERISTAQPLVSITNMRKLLFLTLLLLAFASAASAQTFDPYARHLPSVSADPANCNPGDVTFRSDLTTMRLCTATNTWASVTGASNPFADNTALVSNSADSTKLLILSAASISTGTTRTWTFQNSNDTVVGRATTDTLTNKTFDTAGAGNTFKINGNSITGISGNTATVGTTSGTLTSAHCVKIDANGNLVDAGQACGTTSVGAVIWNTPNASISASQTQYAIGSLAFGTEATRQAPIPVGGTMKNFYFNTGGAQPASGSLVCTVRDANASTALTVTVAASGAAGTFSDTTHTATVSAGDLLDLQCVNNATGASAAIIGWSVTIQ